MRGLVSPNLPSRSFRRSSMLNIRYGTFLGFILGLLVSALLQMGKGTTNPIYISNLVNKTPPPLRITPTPGEPFSNPGFTIVTPSFKREHLLPDFLTTYAGGNIKSLKAIIIQWVDPDSSPSQRFTQSLSRYQTPIFIVRTIDKSLNERFRWPIDESLLLVKNAKAKDLAISTTDVILSIDDDLEFQAIDIEDGFRTFREFASHGMMRMVGFFAREITSMGHYNHQPRDRYNAVLTKGAFLHRDWLQEYFDDDLAEMREYVSQGRNCEDILMTFLVATISEPPPLLFHATGVDASGRKGNHGISTNQDHLLARDKCVKLFQEHFGGEVLKNMVTHMRRHNTGEVLL